MPTTDATNSLTHPRAILFAASEVHPLVKTGGLADVMGSLPQALHDRGHDVRIVLPGYRSALAKVGEVNHVTELMLAVHPKPVNILQGYLPETEIPVYFVDAPEYFDRPGGPYNDEDGFEWPDNAERFALFSRVVCEIAQNRVGLNWLPHVVHCNDWQTGLVPALLSTEASRPATVFTVHNLAYQGLFPASSIDQLSLPKEWWSAEGLEFHNHVSFIKGGLVFADTLTTVSPTYAKEICQKDAGFGLEGLLNDRSVSLHGILNGVDYDVWNTENNPLISCPYSADDLSGKAENKKRLQKQTKLQLDPNIPVIGIISRLVPQKGVDLVIHALPNVLSQCNLQVVILGSGEHHYEKGLLDLAAQYPDNVFVKIGFDEKFAHEIEAGSDMFLMPSRFEPCGLNQIYSMRYGTIPIVHKTGGLADTVTHASPENLLRKQATGFSFHPATPEKLIATLLKAIKLYHNPGSWWGQLIVNAMNMEFGWNKSAEEYEKIYHHHQASNNAPPPRPSRYTTWTGQNYALQKPKH